MGSFWNELLSSCDTMSNVTIICSDGVIASHKIIVASASNFLKNIMISIPSGDDFTILLPDFEKDKVEEFLCLNDTIKKEKDIFAEVDFVHIEPKGLMNYKEEGLSTEDCFQEEGKMFKDDVLTGLLEVKQEMDEGANSLCSETTPFKKTKTKTIGKEQKKKAVEEAIAYFRSDDSISITRAALKYKIDPKTLRACMETGKSYTGGGRKSKVFTEEEEKLIVDKAFQIVQNGEELSSNILKELILKQVEVLKEINPERSFDLGSSDKMRNFVRHFSERHELKQFFTVKKPCTVIKPCSKSAPVAKEDVLSIRDPFSCEDLEKDLIPNPTTIKQRRQNALIHKKIACENALAYFKSDENVSINKAAQTYKIDPKTLSKVIKSGQSYQGGGKRPTLLTKEEENVIVSRAMEVVNSGQHFDSKVFRQILREEVEIININFPDRNLQMSNNLAQHVATRNDLNKFYPEDNKVRDFECDVCFKKFTFKKALVLHQKTLHYSFLQ